MVAQPHCPPVDWYSIAFMDAVAVVVMAVVQIAIVKLHGACELMSRAKHLKDPKKVVGSHL